LKHVKKLIMNAFFKMYQNHVLANGKIPQQTFGGNVAYKLFSLWRVAHNLIIYVCGVLSCFHYVVNILNIVIIFKFIN
jgi:hypothetical protein